MLRHVALVRTDVSEERIASIIRETRIGKLGTTLAVSNRSTNKQKQIPWLLVRERIIPTHAAKKYYYN
jgi:hypothetical protein